MPYKDLDKRRANQRAWVRQKRAGIDRRIDTAGQRIDRVKPKQSIPIRPARLSDDQWTYIQLEAEQKEARIEQLAEKMYKGGRY